MCVYAFVLCTIYVFIYSYMLPVVERIIPSFVAELKKKKKKVLKTRKFIDFCFKIEKKFGIFGLEEVSLWSQRSEMIVTLILC